MYQYFIVLSLLQRILFRQNKILFLHSTRLFRGHIRLRSIRQCIALFIIDRIHSIRVWNSLYLLMSFLSHYIAVFIIDRIHSIRVWNSLYLLMSFLSHYILWPPSQYLFYLFQYSALYKYGWTHPKHSFHALIFLAEHIRLWSIDCITDRIRSLAIISIRSKKLNKKTDIHREYYDWTTHRDCGGLRNFIPGNEHRRVMVRVIRVTQPIRNCH